MASFESVYQHVLLREGGYVNDKDDSGGETNYGITKAVAREYGYNGSMKDISVTTVRTIYKDQYWNALKLDEVENQSVADTIADMGINAGVWRSAKMVQKVLNKEFGSGLVEDGKLGAKTITKLNSVNQEKFHAAFNKLRLGYYDYIMNYESRNVLLDAYFETLHPLYPAKILRGHTKNLKYRKGWYNRTYSCKYKC